MTALLLMKRPHACEETTSRGQRGGGVGTKPGPGRGQGSPTLSSAATKPASLLKADMTKALYFLWTSRVVCTYTLGSWGTKKHSFSVGKTYWSHWSKKPKEVLFGFGSEHKLVDLRVQQGSVR